MANFWDSYTGNPFVDIRKKTPVDKIGTGIGGFLGLPTLEGTGISVAQAMFGTSKKAVTAAAPTITGGIGYGTATLLAGGAGLAGYLFGGKNQQQQPTATAVSQPQANPTITPVVTVRPVIVQPNNTNYYQNQYNIDKSQNWFNISNSPGASISNRKSMQPGMSATSTPTWSTPFSTSTPISVPISQPTTQTPTATAQSGMDWATIAAIAGVALVAYGYTSRKGK